MDFKEKSTSRIAECVASMANAHGGLIFVGITDTDRKIVGVKTETMAHVADMLATRLDPADWLRRCSRSRSAMPGPASMFWSSGSGGIFRPAPS